MESTIDLDKVLLDLGNFGKFQKRNYGLICLVVAFSCLPLSYIFTTRNSKYRCYIEECEKPDGNYNAEWISSAIPFINGDLSRCSRYAPMNNSSNHGTCSTESFDAGRKIICDSFTFENGGNTIEQDFNITCEENLWKLTIIGSLNNVGDLAVLPIAGAFSDRYGRRTTMIVSVLLSTFCGLMKSFAFDYYSFVLMEVLDTALGAGTYSAAYILAIELVVPEQRVLGNTLLSCAFALGEAMLGAVAWMSPSWRVMLRMLYAPGVLFVLYFWCTQESIRWLLSKGEHDKARSVLKKVAKVNGTRLTDCVMKKLTITKEEIKEDENLSKILKEPVLLLRLVNCSWAWICCTFVYYGLTVNSVAISGNLYLNFIAVSCIEIPAYFFSYCTLDRVGRKVSLSASMLISGVACITFVIIPEGNSTLQLILFLIGKFSVTIAYSTTYIYTTEMFPTNLRHSLLAICSMFGRLGAMMAPQVPLLSKVSKSLPLLLFGGMATSSGVLSQLFPETLNTKLPDTIEEAVNIVKKETVLL